MLNEFEDLIDPKLLPRRRKELMYYLSGFADGESCFNISLKRQKTARFGWVLDPVFHVTQHRDNRIVLEIFKRILLCGRIIEKHGQKGTLQFMVDNRRQLIEKVIPFFERYPLIVKRTDFIIFKEIVVGLEAKKHSNIDEFKKLLKRAFEMNQSGKQRRYKLDEVLTDLNLLGSSEAIRQTPEKKKAENAKKG